MSTSICKQYLHFHPPVQGQLCLPFASSRRRTWRLPLHQESTAISSSQTSSCARLAADCPACAGTYSGPFPTFSVTSPFLRAYSNCTTQWCSYSAVKLWAGFTFPVCFHTSGAGEEPQRYTMWYDETDASAVTLYRGPQTCEIFDLNWVPQNICIHKRGYHVHSRAPESVCGHGMQLHVTKANN